MTRKGKSRAKEQEAEKHAKSLEEEFQDLLRNHREDDDDEWDSDLEDFLIRAWENSALLEKAFRGKGGVRAALDAIHMGLTREAAEATIALAHLAEDDNTASEPSNNGIVKALLAWFNVASQSDADTCMLELTLRRIVKKSSTGPAELIAAYSDPDHSIAFSALMFSSMVMDDETACEDMVKAGLVPALLTALSNPALHCQSAAGLIIKAMSSQPKALPMLLRAALVPAMMRVVREGPTQASLSPSERDLLSAWNVDSLFADPFVVMCNVLKDCITESP